MQCLINGQFDSDSKTWKNSREHADQITSF